MRLVLDTNCVVSAFLWGGTPYNIVDSTAMPAICSRYGASSATVRSSELTNRFSTTRRSSSSITTTTWLLECKSIPQYSAMTAS